MSAVRGWCPGALRPMPAGDGLLLRIRPHGSRLSPLEAHGLADLAESVGAGLSLGSRASLQLRGVAEGDLTHVQARLAALGLLDPDPVAEGNRNILVSPIWDGAETPALLADLEAGLATLPPLPPKFGFALDTGPEAVLVTSSADIRIERGASGGLILRADGRAEGVAVTPADAVPRTLALARWFAGQGVGRMARHTGPLPLEGRAEAPLKGAPLPPGPHPMGAVIGLAFGDLPLGVLRALAKAGAGLRLTPWRSVLVEGGAMPPPGAIRRAALITDPEDPLLRVDACPGAPFCPQAEAATRDLARGLAGRIKGHLHVSGCDKGCARQAPAEVALTARAGRFDLALNARPGDTPVERGLTPEAILARYGAT